MRRDAVPLHPVPRWPALCAVLVAALLPAWPGQAGARMIKPAPAPAPALSEPQGSLTSLDADGKPAHLFPLKHTDVKIEVSGFLARARVTQQFENPFPDKIEAVYTFPLPQRAAVDDMTLTVGERVVKAKIKKREDAQAIYGAARAKGRRAALLDQERSNIFTQSVANIMPGEQITVTISYVEVLHYEDGWYELVFPMVVGPRYIPGTPTDQLGGGWTYDPDHVPDASRITPPVVRDLTRPPQARQDAPFPNGTRAGHDIAIEVSLDAGLPIQSLHSKTHEVMIDNPAPTRAIVCLQNRASIPNKDFILRYDVAGGQIQDGLLAHRNGKNGFFTLILQPPDRVTPAEVIPKELVFVLDTSGSMSGFPIEKAKETMTLALEGLYPQDTFNLITFSGDTQILFPAPVPATKENLRKAREFLRSRQGGGGTEMMKAIKTALDPSDSQNHVRIVCFMTDGYVGNDLGIIAEVQKHPNARVFSFGIGSAVNRFLLDKMAEHGRGEVEYVGLTDDGSAAARRFHERVRHPLLTDLSIEWGHLKVTEVYPKRLPDLFSAKPVIVTGRYTAPGKGTVKLHGKLAGRPVTREIGVEFPKQQPQHDALATLWARTRIEDLMAQDYAGVQRGAPKADVRLAVTQLGLDYRLMTHYTSFVAVEEMTITEGGAPRRIDVPVEMPEGVSYEGVFDGGPEAPAPTVGTRAGLTAVGMVAYEEEPSLAKREETDPSARRDVTKLHRSLAAIVMRLEDKSLTPAPEEGSFVKNGKAEIQVWLADASAETDEQLKHLGFELLLRPKSGTLVIGRLPIERLAALAEVDAVRFVAPLLGNT